MVPCIGQMLQASLMFVDTHTRTHVQARTSILTDTQMYIKNNQILSSPIIRSWLWLWGDEEYKHTEKYRNIKLL